jgi:hypothetical protein
MTKITFFENAFIKGTKVEEKSKILLEHSGHPRIKLPN